MQKRKISYPSFIIWTKSKGGVSYSFQYFQNIYCFFILMNSHLIEVHRIFQNDSVFL